MRVTLIALKPTFYHRVGEQFEASEMYAKLAMRLGVARHAEVDEPPVEPKEASPYPMDDPDGILGGSAARKKRTYKRRDLTAEE